MHIIVELRQLNIFLLNPILISLLSSPLPPLSLLPVVIHKVLKVVRVNQFHFTSLSVSLEVIPSVKDLLLLILDLLGSLRICPAKGTTLNCYTLNLQINGVSE